MANTYTQLYIRIILAVKGRESLIPKQHKEAVHQYITRIIAQKNQKRFDVLYNPKYVFDGVDSSEI